MSEKDEVFVTGTVVGDESSLKIIQASAGLGRFLTLVLLIFSVLTGILMIIMGVCTIMRRDEHSESVDGQVVSSNCTSIGASGNKCFDVKVTYQVPGDPTQNTRQYTFSSIDKEIKAGDPIKLFYYANDYGKVETWNSRQYIEEGIVLIVGALVFAGLLGFLYYLVIKFEVAAAVAGPIELAGLLL